MMERSENFTSANTECYGDAGVSTTGPVRATINRLVPAYPAGWVPTMNSPGTPTNKEYLGGNPLGITTSPSSIDYR